jgi:hypothetical protein
MTLKHLPQVTVYLWVATAFWQFMVALVVLRSTFRRTYPAFSSFACFMAVTTPILMVLPGVYYFLGYTIVSAATCVLLWATLFELYTWVCGPHFSLPSWVPHTIASWLALALCASAVATVGLYTVHSMPKRIAVLAAVQGGMLMALFLTLTVLLVYSRHLGMEWKTRPKQIVVGLAIYLSANTVVVFLLNHVSRELATFLDRTGQIAFLLSLIWWTFTLRRREPASEKLTEEQSAEIMATVLAFHRESMEAAELAHTLK